MGYIVARQQTATPNYFDSLNDRIECAYRQLNPKAKGTNRMMNMNPDVDTLLDQKDHPLDAEIQRVREIILSTDERVEEAVKWSSPTFMYKGNIASFFMNAKKFVSLMFHKGVMINDPSGLLEGEGKGARTARFYSLEDIEKKKSDLENVIREWIKIRDER